MLGNPQSIDLPYINVTGEYVVLDSNRITSNGTFEDQQLEFAQARAFLPAVADIGYFEQNLTTDLLNHLIYLQKGFIKVTLLKSWSFSCKFYIPVPSDRSKHSKVSNF